MARYTATHKLPGGRLEGIPEEVTLQIITTFEEKMLLGSTPDVLEQVVKSCLIEDPKNPINFDLLTPADIHFMLMKLKIMTYGPEYFVKAPCRNPNCRTEGVLQEFMVDVDALDIFYLPEDFVEPYAELILPDCKNKVELRIPRNVDSDMAELEAKKYTKKYPDLVGDMGYIFRLMNNIATVDGEKMKRVELQQFVTDLSGKDSAYLRHHTSKVKLGYDTEIIDFCPKCGEEVRFTMPIGLDFFSARFDD